MQLDWRRIPFALIPTATLFSSQTTYNQAAALHRSGAVSTLHFRWYCLFWAWESPRFSDVEDACNKQYRCAKKSGYQALEQRFQRMRCLRAKFIRTLFASYAVGADCAK